MTPLATGISSSVLQQTMHLLDQQIWRWGCDIKHPQGNLLINYGFSRIPNQNNNNATSSVYRIEINMNVRVILRGFAVFFGNDSYGGLLFKRFDSQPYRTPKADLVELPFTQFDLPSLKKFSRKDNDLCQLIAGLIQWIADYESWVKQNFGTQYIENSLKSRDKPPAAPVKETDTAWLEILDSLNN